MTLLGCCSVGLHVGWLHDRGHGVADGAWTDGGDCIVLRCWQPCVMRPLHGKLHSAFIQSAADPYHAGLLLPPSRRRCVLAIGRRCKRWQRQQRPAAA